MCLVHGEIADGLQTASAGALGTISTGKDVQESPSFSRDQAVGSVLADPSASAVWSWSALTVEHLPKENLLCISPQSFNLWCWAHLFLVGAAGLRELSRFPTSLCQQLLAANVSVVSKKGRVRVSI